MNDKKGFKYWYENVFKFHYGKWAIFFAIVAAVIIFTTVESIVNRVKYDFCMAVVVREGAIFADISELERLVGTAVGDIDGDGKINVFIELVDLSNDYEEKLMLLMSQPEYVVFIMDEDYSRYYAGKGDFNDLTRYGFSPDSDIPGRIYIGDCRIMDSLELNTTFYACLADWTTDGKGKKLWTEAGVRVINAILDTKK